MHRRFARRWARRERGCGPPPISTPGAEGGPDRYLNAVHNRGEHSSPWFCSVFLVVAHAHRRSGRQWRPGEVGAPPRRIAPHHRGIRRSRSIKCAEWRRTLSFVILRPWCACQARPSPSHPAMDESGGEIRGGAPLPRRFLLPAQREASIDGTRRHRTSGKTLPRGSVPLFKSVGVRSRNSPRGDGPPLEAFGRQYCIKYWPGRNGQIHAKEPGTRFLHGSKESNGRESL